MVIPGPFLQLFQDVVALMCCCFFWKCLCHHLLFFYWERPSFKLQHRYVIFGKTSLTVPTSLGNHATILLEGGTCVPSCLPLEGRDPDILIFVSLNPSIVPDT